MCRWLLYVPVVLALGGCQTHLCLRDSTLRTGATLTDLNYQQVLNNLALFVANPSAMPSIAVFNCATIVREPARRTRNRLAACVFGSSRSAPGAAVRSAGHARPYCGAPVAGPGWRMSARGEGRVS